MGDLISRQVAIRLAEQGQIQGFEWQFKKLCELPSAEPEIIHCKDCKFAHKTYDGDIKHCDMWTDEFGIPLEMYLDGDFYCKYGKKR